MRYESWDIDYGHRVPVRWGLVPCPACGRGAMVDYKRDLWHCLGCQEGGDVHRWRMLRARTVGLADDAE